MTLIGIILIGVFMGVIANYLVKSAMQSGDYFQSLVERKNDNDKNYEQRN